MKKMAFGISLIVLISIVAACTLNTNEKVSIAEKAITAVSAAVKEMGYSLTFAEEIKSPIIYKNEVGDTITFYQYYCTDAEHIKDGKVAIYETIFNPNMADRAKDTSINDDPALLCELEGLSYLVWYPNDNTILMLEYDSESVRDEDIIKMAESTCSGNRR